MENENKNKDRRFKVMVVDLSEDKVLVDATTDTVMLTVGSPFDNLTGEDRSDYTMTKQYFNCRATDILNCIRSTVEGIAKMAAEHKELGFLLNLWLLSKQAKSLEESEEEDEDDE